jgi:two-component system, OmpR family, sensor kinase
VSRLPIRLRLTAAFALAMLLVLGAAGLFVYLRLADDLDEAVDRTLEARAEAVVAPAGERLPPVGEDPEEAFAQLLDRGGRLLDASGGAREPALTPREAARAAEDDLTVERELDGIEGAARVLALPAGGRVVVIGESLDDRDETLSGLVSSFLVGGPVAVLLASLLGYGLATAGLRPVEAIRRRAREISLGGGARERLPLPEANDEIRRLGRTLNEMLDRLDASFERERRFVADASHELRTPVAVLKTELDGALRAGGHAPGVREALLAAVAECDHLAQLADDLLVVARAGGGELPVRPERLEARPLLEGARDRFAERARGHGRAIEVELEGEPAVRADPLRARQALGNLVDNALRHGEGTVILRARERDGAAELEVADEGAGFPPEIAGRAFERFARGDAARTRGGTGLGLAIVRAIAEAHGGSAEIEGALVRLRFPSQGGLSRAAYGPERPTKENR